MNASLRIVAFLTALALAAAVRAAPPDASKAATLVVDQTNDFRVEQKLPRVELNDTLTKTAQEFAAFMARTGKYGHTVDGRQPADRVKAQGYEFCVIAENIAAQYNSAGFTTGDLAGKFVQGWKDSPGHRKNMLDADALETGVAIARSEKTGYYYAVQLFGRPKSKALEFSIRNDAESTACYQVGDQTFELLPRYTRTHQVCRPSQAALRWTDAAGKTRSVQPANGDRYSLRGEKLSAIAGVPRGVP